MAEDIVAARKAARRARIAAVLASAAAVAEVAAELLHGAAGPVAALLKLFGLYRTRRAVAGWPSRSAHGDGGGERAEEKNLLASRALAR